MKATDFERRHQTLLHLLLMGISLSTYLGDRVDIVWRLVRNHSDNALLEHVVFGVGALMMLGSALLDTWGNARTKPLPLIPLMNADRSGFNQRYRFSSAVHIYAQFPSHFARLLLASAIGLLLPLSGAVVLLVGETILVLRLFLRDQESISGPPLPSRSVEVSLGAAFRAAASKWGLAASMIVFAWTLQDRIAEIGAASSFVLWLVLNLPMRLRSHSG